MRHDFLLITASFFFFFFKKKNVRLKEQLRELENKKKNQYMDQDEKSRTEHGKNTEKILHLNKQIKDLGIENEVTTKIYIIYNIKILHLFNFSFFF